MSSIGTTCAWPPPAAPPFMPKFGPSDGLADADHRLLADPVQPVAEAHGGGGLALAGRGRVDRGDQHQLAVRPAVERADEVLADLGLVMAVGQQMLGRDAKPGADLQDRLFRLPRGRFRYRSSGSCSLPRPRSVPASGRMGNGWAPPAQGRLRRKRRWNRRPGFRIGNPVLRQCRVQRLARPPAPVSRTVTPSNSICAQSAAGGCSRVLASERQKRPSGIDQ